MKIEQLELKIRDLTNRNKTRQIGFVIGATSNYTSKDDFYVTPIRESKFLSYMGVIVKNVEVATRIAVLVDGLVEYIFVDAEKKISSKHYGINDAGNLEKAVSQVVKDSRILTFKGNDLTAYATDSLLRVLTQDISGMKIAVLGVGNIGTKIALLLLERGANVYLFSHQLAHSRETAILLNRIKLRYVISECVAAESIQDALMGTKIVLATSNRKDFIGNDMLEDCYHDSEKGFPVLVDVGKGCFKRESVQTYPAVYRIDVEDFLSSEFDNLIQLWNLLANTSVRGNIENLNLVRRGIVGLPGEIVVDNPTKPTRFLGACSNDGTLRQLDDRTKQILSKID